MNSVDFSSFSLTVVLKAIHESDGRLNREENLKKIASYCENCFEEMAFQAAALDEEQGHFVINKLQCLQRIIKKEQFNFLDGICRKSLGCVSVLRGNLLPDAVAGISKTVNYLQELEKKSGAIWECVEKKDDPLTGGDFYLYRIKPACKSSKGYSEQYHKIFPAIEMSEEMLCDSLEMPLPKFYQALGYQFIKEDGDLCVQLPSVVSFNRRYEELRKTNPNLPPFVIGEASGALNDRDFIAMYLEYDAVVSSDRELFHDQTVHVLQTLMYMYLEDGQAYRALKEKELADYKDILEMIEIAKKQISDHEDLSDYAEKIVEGLYAALGVYIDSRFIRINHKIKTIDQMINEYFKDPDWPAYFLKRFPEKDETGNSLIMSLVSEIFETIRLERCA